MKQKTRKLVWGSFWLALGIILPQIFHLIGGPGLGRVFLPMHLPVFFAGLTIGPALGTMVGVLSPVLSHLLTGMPPMSPPIAVLMVFELSAYGLFSGMLYVKLKKGLITTLIISMVMGRLVLGAAVTFIAPLFGFSPSPLVYLKGAVMSGIPGIILQLLLIPAILNRSKLVQKIKML